MRPSSEILLSEYGCASRMPSPVNRMMSAFAADFREGIDINLGVGYVNENTIPRALIVKALQEVLACPGRYKSPLNYGGPKGSPSLIDSLRRYHVSHGIGGLTERILAGKEIIIGPNGATSLLEGLAHVLRPGIVITSDPMYYIYCDFLERRGFTVVTVPERMDGLHADDVARRIDELGEDAQRISFLYVVTVNNPTATIITNRERSALVRLVTGLSRRLGRTVPLVLDKAYEDLIHDPAVEKPRSGFLDDEDGVVFEIGTLSKIIAPSLRIGYLIGQGRPVPPGDDPENERCRLQRPAHQPGDRKLAPRQRAGPAARRGHARVPGEGHGREALVEDHARGLDPGVPGRPGELLFLPHPGRDQDGRKLPLLPLPCADHGKRKGGRPP